jgi:hypothetical protein
MKYNKPKIVSHSKDKTIDVKSALSGDFPVGKVFL